ncbi:uncharacterized protein [Bemisia tabaci]
MIVKRQLPAHQGGHPFIHSFRMKSLLFCTSVLSLGLSFVYGSAVSSHLTGERGSNRLQKRDSPSPRRIVEYGTYHGEDLADEMEEPLKPTVLSSVANDSQSSVVAAKHEPQSSGPDPKKSSTDLRALSLDSKEPSQDSKELLIDLRDLLSEPNKPDTSAPKQASQDSEESRSGGKKSSLAHKELSQDGDGSSSNDYNGDDFEKTSDYESEPSYPEEPAPQKAPLDSANPPVDFAKPPSGSAKPVPDVAKPSPEASKPSSEAAKPSPDSAKPSSEAAKPSPGSTKPVPDVTKPSTEATKPSSEATKPSPDSTKPLPDVAKPSPEAAKPSSETTRPSPGFTKPSSDVAKPSPEAAKPSSEGAKPSPDSTKPLPGAAKPSPDSTKPLPVGAAKPSPDAAKPSPESNNQDNQEEPVPNDDRSSSIGKHTSPEKSPPQENLPPIADIPPAEYIPPQAYPPLPPMRQIPTTPPRPRMNKFLAIKQRLFPASWFPSKKQGLLEMFPFRIARLYESSDLSVQNPDFGPEGPADSVPQGSSVQIFQGPSFWPERPVGQGLQGPSFRPERPPYPALTPPLPYTARPPYQASSSGQAPSEWLSDAFIDAINTEQSRWKAGRNFGQRLTNTEMEYLVARNPIVPDRNLINILQDITTSLIPNLSAVFLEYLGFTTDEYDGRRSWCEGGPQDTGYAATSWALASAAALRQRVCMLRGVSDATSYAAEFIINCCRYCERTTNGGGSAMVAYQYMRQLGTPSDECQKYKRGKISLDPDPRAPIQPPAPRACSKVCDDGNRFPTSRDRLNKFVNRADEVFYITPPWPSIIRREIMRGSVTAEVTVYTDFPNYKEGVYSPTKIAVPWGNITVRLIGWGSEGGQDFWQAAGIWGPNFGDKGYVKFKQDCPLLNIEQRITAARPHLDDLPSE